MAHYLRRDKRAFDVVSRAIRAGRGETLHGPQWIVVNNDKFDPADICAHPETLLHGLNCYIGDDVAWRAVLGVLRTRMPGFNTLKLHVRDLKKLERYDWCNNCEIQKAVLEALSGLSEAELKRVKLLLSWTIVQAYGKVNRACICTSSPDHLTEQIFAKYSEHAAYVMSLVFTQIERPDLLDKLAEAASVRREAEAIPDEALRGNAPA